jgi:hypothetical protein
MRAMRPGYTITNHKACRGRTGYLLSRGGTDIGWEVNAGGFLGVSRAYPWTLPGTGKHSSKCKVMCHVTKWTEVSHLHKAARKIIGRCNVLEPQCSIVGKPFRSWNLRLSTIQHTARTLRFRISICWTPKGSSQEVILFADDDEVKEAVHDERPCTQLKQFFSVSIRKLVDHWTKCAEMHGQSKTRYTHTKSNCGGGSADTFLITFVPNAMLLLSDPESNRGTGYFSLFASSELTLCTVEWEVTQY